MDFVFDSLANAIVLAFFSIFILYYLFLNKSSKLVSHSKEAPIVQGAWPILGHLPLLKASQGPHRVLGALADKYGPLINIKLGSKRVLVISNWEMAKECFTKMDSIVSNRPKLESTQHLGYNGAMFSLSPYNSYWRQIRKLANSEILSHHRVEQLQPFRVKVVRASIKELYNVWYSNESKSSEYVLVELKEWFTQLSTNIVLPSLIGKKRYFNTTNGIDKEEEQKFMIAMKELLRLLGVFTVGDAIPFLKWFDIGGHVKAMKKASKELDNILGELLEKRRRNKSSNDNEIDRDNQDFMDALIAGAVDTTSVTVIWAICLLVNNPLALEKVKEELNTQVGKERCVKESDIDKLIYLQAIVKEALRTTRIFREL
ncbi:hypothetical protein RYX36_005547 [Vicia faba]